MDNIESARWAVLKESVCGASHVKSGLPNQDSYLAIPHSHGDTCTYPYIIAVCDGHGSAKSFRSQRGSQLAAFSAVEVTNDFIKETKGQSLSFIKNTFEDMLIKKILAKWRERVEHNLEKIPFSDSELAIIKEKYGDKGLDDLKNNPCIAYGTTLLLVAVTAEYVFFMQNGDGDILVVQVDGEVERPLPDDPRLIANETTSLSSEKAWEDFRVSFQTLSGKLPKLILLATDGYANSFRSEDDFLKVGHDMLQTLQQDGVFEVEQSLKGWLEDASKSGSGDDVTVGMLYRIDDPVLNK